MENNSKMLIERDILEGGSVRRWRKNGFRHREDGPSTEWDNGTKYWFINERKHRIDGPAVEWRSGDRDYWLNGKPLSKEEWEEQREK